ncbi:MAG: hypothetical protein FH749_09070 [Firmicutes bacterium]|nr:hypothetical protein [Bacillota bacterium]
MQDFSPLLLNIHTYRGGGDMQISIKEVLAVSILAVMMAIVGTCNLRSAPPAESTEADASVLVHVAGAVNNPGVYELTYGARVQDALAAAGGIKSEGNADTLNLAAYVFDGQKIYVPALQRAEQTESQTNGLININVANLSELQTLPGIGPAIAERIITYREQTGGFSSPEDIMNVDRIGPKTFENIRSLICVE